MILVQLFLEINPDGLLFRLVIKSICHTPKTEHRNTFLETPNGRVTLLVNLARKHLIPSVKCFSFARVQKCCYEDAVLLVQNNVRAPSRLALPSARGLGTLSQFES